MITLITILIIYLLTIFYELNAQTATKTIQHYCDPKIPDACGNEGVCIEKFTGNRCRCPRGFMGYQCKRPCQDIYLSCTQWKSDGRCVWTRPILPFFEDNCAYTCRLCESNGKKLRLPLPPILEPISWLIGRWETTTHNGFRAPYRLKGGYRETLDISISEVPSFDRPPLNVTVHAISLDGYEELIELGFITGKPFNDSTGYVDYNKPKEGSDLVALELVSNTGLMTIEEGTSDSQKISLDLKFSRDNFHVGKAKNSVHREFSLDEFGALHESGLIEYMDGTKVRWRKQFKKTIDYLSTFVNDKIE